MNADMILIYFFIILKKLSSISSIEFDTHNLMIVCKSDIQTMGCYRDLSKNKHVRLAQTVICLESSQKQNLIVSTDCVNEMFQYRSTNEVKYLPEILHECSYDFTNYCSDLPTHEILNCLIKRAHPGRNKDHRVSTKCQRALEIKLVKENDLGEDYWSNDVGLRKTCKSVSDCMDTDAKNNTPFLCLINNLETNNMTTGCEVALKEIQYFDARTFNLHPDFYRICGFNIHEFCSAKKKWRKINLDEIDPDHASYILACLYHNNEALESQCNASVKKIMNQRAISVDLFSGIEDVCIVELTKFCSGKTEYGEEFYCLQENIDKLQEKCKSALLNYKAEESKNIKVSPTIKHNCKNAITSYCESIMKNGKDEGEVMECLVRYKNYPDLRDDMKCSAVIQHYQIVSLKNYNITNKLSNACPRIYQFCPNCNRIYDIIVCLSETIRNDTITDQQQSIPTECIIQIRGLVYEQHKRFDLVQNVNTVCHNDIENFVCINITDGEKLLDCLVLKETQISDKCREVVYESINYQMLHRSLYRICADEMQWYCPTGNENKFQCLYDIMNDNTKSIGRPCNLELLRIMEMEEEIYEIMAGKTTVACKWILLITSIVAVILLIVSFMCFVKRGKFDSEKKQKIVNKVKDSLSVDIIYDQLYNRKN